MVFSSIPFLYYFLPCVLILCLAAPKRAKNAVLLIGSLFFYAWSGPKLLLVMLVSITQGYVFGLLIGRNRGGRRAKLFLVLSLVISLGILCYCKYTGFFLSSINTLFGAAMPVPHIILPMGVSFYTFQIVSYTVDVYRGDAAPQRNYVALAAYISMFPQLVAGPIVRYSDISQQLVDRSVTIAGCAEGIRRFTFGLAKKILIANTLGELCAVFRAADEKSVLFFWLYAAAYTLHIYFDFSGYSDMAIGLGKLFGFDLPENFRYPYIARSITDFWRRWHMSLGTWFRDYVYIPLGGNRVGRCRWLFNLLVVWVLTGLWHGAAWNFAVWGLLFAVLLMVEKLGLLKLLDRSRVLCHVYVIVAVMIGFVIFDSPDLATAGSCIGAMFGAGDYPLVSAESVYCLRSWAVILLVGVIGSTPLVPQLIARLRAGRAADRALNVLEPVVVLVLLCVCTAYIVDGSFNPFLYFRF